MTVAPRGKSFTIDGAPFLFRGASYRPRSASRPDQLALDLAAMAADGYTVVGLPAVSPPAIEPVAANRLRALLQLEDLDVARLAAASRRERGRLARELAVDVRRWLAPWRGSGALLGMTLGIAPGSRIGSGPDVAWQVANELAVALHDEDPTLLAAWRSPWPLGVGCPAEFDFLIVDCELAREDALAPALMCCHGYVGDRPLVLGGVSLPGGEARDLEWLIDVALRSGAGGTMARWWSPAEAARAGPGTARVNRRTVRDLDVSWPSISVVVNAHNAQDTLPECLRHCDRLDYPELEVIVVDDGSTDATPTIAAAHSRVRLLTIPRSGLSEGRNVGYRAARGELVAYLDADAYPSPEWPWYLALAALPERVDGSGGPNVPPPGEPVAARVVARSPGGPLPRLLQPDRAEHLPGCNMAFWKRALEECGGFDPVLQATEDVELEWRLSESGGELAYHPAALIWHHPRSGLRPYLRQQRHYGRGQAIVERRYPERFPAGYRVRKAVARLRSRHAATRHGSFPVRYLTLARDDSARLELAHQWGVPATLAIMLTAPLALKRRGLGVPAAAAGAYLGGLFAMDVHLAGKGRRRSDRGLALRCRVAALRLLRPLAFRWGHLRGWWEFRGRTPDWPPPPAGPHRRTPERRMTMGASR